LEGQQPREREGGVPGLFALVGLITLLDDLLLLWSEWQRCVFRRLFEVFQHVCGTSSSSSSSSALQIFRYTQREKIYFAN
jgi:hypothetical protein